MPWSLDQLETWIGRPAVDKDGHKVGEITDVYMDDATGNPEWLAVIVNKFFSNRISFVPLAEAIEDGNNVRVAYKKALIKDSPSIELDGDMSNEEEHRLYRHYGLAHPSSRDAAEREVGEMQESGSGSVNNEISPELARQRLNRRDEALVDFIDLDAEEPAPKSPADSGN